MKIFRQPLPELATTHWDVLVIGGGISGAGVASEAARCGVKTLLLEQRDFAWGSSSRSSKMVHGGLRYLAQGRFNLVREAVHERERFLAEAPGLVEPLQYFFPHYQAEKPYSWQVGLMLAIYDFFAGVRHRKSFTAKEVLAQIPDLKAQGLLGAHQYTDASTDDARMVMRLLKEAVSSGATVRNYTQVFGLQRDAKNYVCGVYANDTTEEGVTVPPLTISARVVINATGAWTDKLRFNAPRIRPLRGSHIVIAHERIRLHDALIVTHPKDGRAVFIFPWSGCIVIGTTDLDHRLDLQFEPTITSEELEYLLAVGNHLFPTARLSSVDIRSTWAGVRPTIAGHADQPSRLSREHAVWVEEGLFTLTGGKLTTFRLMANDVLDKASKILPALKQRDRGAVEFRRYDPSGNLNLEPETLRRLIGWYGKGLEEILNVVHEDDHAYVPGTKYLKSEIRYIANNEAVQHLEDLMLRRTRMGIICPEGGAAMLPILQPLLGWEEKRWQEEVERYLALWRRCYYLPGDI